MNINDKQGFIFADENHKILIPIETYGRYYNENINELQRLTYDGIPCKLIDSRSGYITAVFDKTKNVFQDWACYFQTV